MIYNNDYIKTLTNLQINKKVLDKTYNKFLQKYSLDVLSKNNSWWNMINVEEPQNVVLNKNLFPYMNESIMIVTMFPKQFMQPHIDFKDNNAAINIPFANCNNKTITKFYEHPNNQTRFVCRDDFQLGARQLIDTDKLVNTFSFSISKYPVLFRPEKPHSVVNNGDKVRIMLSWRFKPEYSWEEAYQLCKDYCLL